ncbi:BTB/POZ domain containing protein [Hordeum vulgare]|nr:BTB/POZ domain containing protein [Hordeum vulgare]
MEAPVFKAFLSFMYTDSLPEMAKKEEDAMYQHLLVAADRYNMERLKLICQDKLCRRIDGSSVANVLALAEFTTAAISRTRAWNFSAFLQI